MKTQAIWPCNVAAVGIALLVGPVPARTQGGAVLVETPAKVFASFYAARTMTKKDEFEKTKDFLKRVEGAFDLNRTYFFPVKNRNTTRGNANYQYDADAEKLVAIAGHKPDHDNAKASRGAAVVIDTISEEQGSYLGKAADGQKVNVKRASVREFVLNFLNTSKLSEVLTPGENKLVVAAKVAPDEARKASGDLEVVVGVRFVSLSRARFELVYGHAPTLAEPWNSETTMACLDCNVARVLVRHRATGKVFRDLTIPPVQRTPIWSSTWLYVRLNRSFAPDCITSTKSPENHGWTSRTCSRFATVPRCTRAKYRGSRSSRIA